MIKQIDTQAGQETVEQRQRDKQTDRQTSRQTDSQHTYMQIDSQSNRQCDSLTLKLCVRGKIFKWVHECVCK